MELSQIDANRAHLEEVGLQAIREGKAVYRGEVARLTAPAKPPQNLHIFLTSTFLKDGALLIFIRRF